MRKTSNRPPEIRLYADEIVVDNFAGGGGASTGISWAIGRDPDIAINHDPEAIAMHKANHPNTKHHVSDVFDIDPRRELAAFGPGKKVGLAWFSPDCTFHSKARGAKPFRDPDKARRRRGLAGVVLKWAEQVRPRIIALENVEEFQDWGPLDKKTGKVDEFKKGFNFRRWWARLENLGYKVEMRELVASDFGAPTTRNRLYILARCDGQPIAWPEATHAKPTPVSVAAGLQPWRTAADCIDWSIPCPSIFLSRDEAAKLKKQTGIAVKRPLSDKTLRRIAAGIERYVLKSGDPFIVPVNHGSSKFDGDGLGRSRPLDEPLRTITAHDSNFAVVSPVLIQTSWGERKGQRPRYLDIHEPVGTIMAGGIKHSVVQARLERVAAFVAKHYGGEHKNGRPKAGAGTDPRHPLDTVTANDHNFVITAHLMNMKGSMADRSVSGQELDQPAPTITAGGNHAALVYAFMLKYYGTDQDPRLGEPMHTLTTKDRMAVVTVTVAGEQYVIVDIGMRMLTPRELYRAQGFPEDYKIDFKYKGKRLPKKSQVRMCGNSCSPYPVEAMLTPNLIHHEEERAEESA